MHIACSINREYIPHMCAMALSVYLNTSAKEINFHILHYELKIEDENSIINEFKRFKKIKFSFYKINPNLIINIPIVAKHLSIESLYRLMLPTVLPEEITKIIYIDSDIIVKDDLIRVWDEDVEEYYLAAVTNLDDQMYKILELDSQIDYFNSGFILVNLKKWRENNFFDKCIDYAQKNPEKVIFSDQDILNGVLHGNWKRLDPKWNVITGLFGNEKLFLKYFNLKTFHEITQCPSVIHYTGLIKPWHINCEHPLVEEYYYYANQLRWKYEVPYGINLLKENKVFLFGTGEYAKKITAKLKHFNANIVGYLDNNTEKWGSKFQNKPVFNPQIILGKQNASSKIFIIISSSFEDEILKQIYVEYKLDSNFTILRFRDLYQIK